MHWGFVNTSLCISCNVWICSSARCQCQVLQSHCSVVRTVGWLYPTNIQLYCIKQMCCFLASHLQALPPLQPPCLRLIPSSLLAICFFPLVSPSCRQPGGGGGSPWQPTVFKLYTLTIWGLGTLLDILIWGTSDGDHVVSHQPVTRTCTHTGQTYSVQWSPHVCQPGHPATL